MTLASHSAKQERVAEHGPTNRALVALVSVLFFAPTMLFATSLRPAVAALEILGCIAALALIARDSAPDRTFLDAPIDRRLLAIMIAVSGALLLLGGALHFVYGPEDWRTRDAVLADISSNWFPVLYRSGETDYLLRAPLGMYVTPGLVGRLFGLTRGHVAMWIQNAVLLGASLYVFAQIGRGWAHAAIFLCSAGFSLAGICIYWFLSGDLHLFYLVKYGPDAWNPYFQYSGSLMQLFWGPNHALSAWWLAALMILQSRRQVDIATIGATIGGTMFWSPLSILPAFGWVVWRVLVDWRACFASRRLWLLLAISPCYLPIALYLVADTSSIAHGLTAAQPQFILFWILFIAVQLVQAQYAFANREVLPASLIGLLWYSVAFLILLPLYSFGPANDLVMRGSSSALAVMAFAFGAAVLAPENRGKRPFRVGLAIVVACLSSAIYELARPMLHARYDISDCSLFEANAAMRMTGVSTNYAAARKAIPTWLIDLDHAPRLVAADRACWSDGGDPDYRDGRQ